MAKEVKCPRCGNEKSWVIRRGKRKCSICKYEWKAARLPLRLTLAEWKRLLRWFLLGQSSARIAKEAHLERKRILRALNIVRETMSHHVPFYNGQGRLFRQSHKAKPKYKIRDSLAWHGLCPADLCRLKDHATFIANLRSLLRCFEQLSVDMQRVTYHPE